MVSAFAVASLQLGTGAAGSNGIVIAVVLALGRGVQIFQSRSPVNTSWSTAIFGDRGSITSMNIVNG